MPQGSLLSWKTTNLTLLVIGLFSIERRTRWHYAAESKNLLGGTALAANPAQLKFLFSSLRELCLITWFQAVFSHDHRWDCDP